MNKQTTLVPAGTAAALQVLGAEVRFLCEAAHTDHAWSLMEVASPLDAGPRPHYHAWDEAYYVLEGEFEFDIDGDRRRVRTGDFVYVPGGVLHGFRGALPDQTSRLLVFDAPAHAEVFFKEVDRQVRGPQDLPKVPQIGAANGIHFAAPAPRG